MCNRIYAESDLINERIPSMETWLESIVAGLVSWCDGIPNRSWKESRVVRFFFRGDKSGQPEVGGIRALGRRKRMEADSPFRILRSLVSFFTSFAFLFQSIHSDSDPCFR